MFNSLFYLEYYPDLKKGNILTHKDATLHWKQYGINEKRFGSSYDLFKHHFMKNYKNSNINVTEINNFSKLKLIYHEIDENLNSFILTLKSCPYLQNILIICGDHPGYGGAATNSLRLLNFFQSNISTNTKSVFFSYEDFYNKTKYENCYFTTSEKLNYIQDIKKFFDYKLVILKSPISTELLNFFRQNGILIIYFISGIFTNDLNEDYTKFNSHEIYNKYINKNVLSQIKLSDFSFVNSYHVNQILKNIYNLDTFIFYSSFVQYFKLKYLETPNYNIRTIDYALIVSNFDRKIKNVTKSIKYLKEKVYNGYKIVLIGKNSEKYALDGMETLDLQDSENMQKLYKSIKNIVDSSYFESANNVRIEGIMNGCNYIYLE